jgi:trimeric autotransporter adhesin
MNRNSRALALFTLLVLSGCTSDPAGVVVKPTTLAFTSSPADVRAGQTATFTAVVRDGNSATVSGSTVTYSIAAVDAAFATINSATGVLTASTVLPAAERGITVTASATTSSGYTAPANATASIVVKSRVTAVALTPSALNLRVGDPPAAMTAVATIAAGSPSSPAVTYSYSSSNNSQATVDATGRVTAVAATSAGAPVTITASAEGVSSNIATVTVLPAIVPTIAITPKPRTLQTGQTLQLDATVTNPAAGPVSVVWDSPDRTRVDVSPTGLVTARATTLAPVRVTARYTAGTTTVTDFVDLDVIVPPVLALSTRDASVQVGAGAVVLSSVANDVPGSTVTWIVRPAGVATVDPAAPVGSVTLHGESPGTTYAIATLSGVPVPQRDSVRVTVSASPAAASDVSLIAVDPLNVTMRVGGSFPYRAQLFNGAGAAATAATGALVQYSSSNTAVATIDATTGVARGVSAGMTIITARYVVNGQTISTDQTLLRIIAPPATGAVAVIEVGTLGRVLSVAAGLTTISGLTVRARDATGTDLGSSVSVTVALSNPAAIQITSQNLTTGLVVTATFRGVVPTPTPPATDPLRNAVRIMVDSPGGLHAEILVRVVN